MHGEKGVTCGSLPLDLALAFTVIWYGLSRARTGVLGNYCCIFVENQLSLDIYFIDSQ